MIRIKRGNVARKRRKKILTLAKGFRGSHSRLFRIAHGQVLKAMRYAYNGRKERKIKFRQLWITRINGMVREFYGITYSTFISRLKTTNIRLNRKMLAQLLILDTMTFIRLKQNLFASSH